MSNKLITRPGQGLQLTSSKPIKHQTTAICWVRDFVVIVVRDNIVEYLRGTSCTKVSESLPSAVFGVDGLGAALGALPTIDDADGAIFEHAFHLDLTVSCRFLARIELCTARETQALGLVGRRWS
jgi:hypothetical protein